MKNLYLYIHPHLKSKRLFIRNKQEKKRYEVWYLKKSTFRGMKKQTPQGANEDNAYVIGYTSWKKSKKYTDEQLVGEVNAANDKFAVLKKRQTFHRVKGFLCTVPYDEVKTYDAESGSAEFYGNPNPKWIAITQFSLLPLLPLLALILLLLLVGVKGCQHQEVPNPFVPESTTVQEETTENPRLPIDASSEKWDGELPENDSAPQQGEIEVLGYDKLQLDADNPYLPLINPPGNTVYFKFTVRNGATILDTTDLIPPGQCVYWNAKESLPAGEYTLILNIATYDVTTQAQYNGANVAVEVTIV